jgi:hypothetical protein
MAIKVGRSVTTSSDGEAAADDRHSEGVPEYGSDARDLAAMPDADR